MKKRLIISVLAAIVCAVLFCYNLQYFKQSSRLYRCAGWNQDPDGKAA
jgi:hypothetical protein